jgi:hypothetical protein
VAGLDVGGTVIVVVDDEVEVVDMVEEEMVVEVAVGVVSRRIGRTGAG